MTDRPEETVPPHPFDLLECTDPYVPVAGEPGRAYALRSRLRARELEADNARRPGHEDRGEGVGD